MADLISGKARGARFREIREALGDGQEAFAERLTEAARALGIEVRYTLQQVSVRETGRRELDIDDYTIATAVDPVRRSSFWLAYGREAPLVQVATRPKDLPPMYYGTKPPKLDKVAEKPAKKPRRRNAG